MEGGTQLGPGFLLVLLAPVFLAVLVLYGIVSTTWIWWRERRTGAAAIVVTARVPAPGKAQDDSTAMPSWARVVGALIGLAIVGAFFLLLIVVARVGAVSPG